jgi:hypothetical protein
LEFITKDNFSGNVHRIAFFSLHAFADTALKIMSGKNTWHNNRIAGGVISAMKESSLQIMIINQGVR